MNAVKLPPTGKQPPMIDWQNNVWPLYWKQSQQKHALIISCCLTSDDARVLCRISGSRVYIARVRHYSMQYILSLFLFFLSLSFFLSFILTSFFRSLSFSLPLILSMFLSLSDHLLLCFFLNLLRHGSYLISWFSRQRWSLSG